ncbi:MAG: Spy/CpxP family protein refolding chaperone [Chthoniobacter sp.]|uniref:Spy/CpxP family protein refolding chaperone n=1 Tax=Chthoniobacter sp. TaxID=2510640 RepID=UPI0032A44CF0
MKKHLAVLSFVVAGLCAAPSLLRADDAVPPKPPGGDKAPADSGKAPSAAPKAPGRAGGGGGAGRMSPEERLKKMTEELNLTQEQQDKVKAIMEKSAPQFKELMAKGRESMTEEDKTKVRELIKTQMEDIAAVLTPEQKEKFKAAMEKRRAAGGGAPGAK